MLQHSSWAPGCVTKAIVTAARAILHAGRDLVAMANTVAANRPTKASLSPAVARGSNVQIFVPVLQHACSIARNAQQVHRAA